MNKKITKKLNKIRKIMMKTNFCHESGERGPGVQIYKHRPVDIIGGKP